MMANIYFKSDNIGCGVKIQGGVKLVCGRYMHTSPSDWLSLSRSVPPQMIHEVK